ncbi:MAG TPA: hypothetical protein VNJ01_00085 [Bacteriovoracaceae bacterium]|nr:hypothetical protein [Bacteriovoracaceae bacterium]
MTLSFIVVFSVQASWDQPQVLCPEEIFPKGVPCLDLSQVKEPSSDFPLSLTAEEKIRWQSVWASDLKFCRNLELLKRETVRPGTLTPVQIQIAWMITNGAQMPQEKLSAILDASSKYDIPPHVLIGAITQESLLSSLGISPDGGNYSCGIAQLNIEEWCQGINSLPQDQRTRISWPQISCASLKSGMLEPFYELAKQNLGTRPEYRIEAADFKEISFEQVRSQLPAADAGHQLLKYQAITSFINNCQDFRLSIFAKALTLRKLFEQFVPKELRSAEVYRDNTRFNRSCQSSYSSTYYPLHTGWLLAVAIYNAGPRQTQLIQHYHQNPAVLPPMNPTDLIEALHWGGNFVEGTKKVFFKGRDAKAQSQLWYKSCVVQRHVSRVIQHVSPPGKPLARSIEQAACNLGEVPLYRRDSSGVKAN